MEFSSYLCIVIRKERQTNVNMNQLKVNSNMSNNNIYSDGIKKRQAAIFLELQESLGINGYICNGDEYTDFRENLTDMLVKRRCIRPSYKVKDMWFDYGKICRSDKQNIDSVYFNLSACDRNYNEVTITSDNYRSFPKNTFRASEKTLSLILDECDKLINKLRQMRDDAKKTPKVSELMETLLSYAQKHIDKDRYTVEWENGKLNMEDSGTEQYNCLVVRHNNGEYHSSIVFSKNEIGNYYAILRTPLCGQCKVNFTLDTAEEQIKKIINF
mgnify:FL=1